MFCLVFVSEGAVGMLAMPVCYVVHFWSEVFTALYCTFQYYTHTHTHVEKTHVYRKRIFVSTNAKASRSINNTQRSDSY